MPGLGRAGTHQLVPGCHTWGHRAVASGRMCCSRAALGCPLLPRGVRVGLDVARSAAVGLHLGGPWAQRLRAGRRDGDVGSGEQGRCEMAAGRAARGCWHVGQEAGGADMRGQGRAGAGSGRRVCPGFSLVIRVRSWELRWPSVGCRPVLGWWGAAAHGHGPHQSGVSLQSACLLSFRPSLQRCCLLALGGGGCAVGMCWPRHPCWLRCSPAKQ